MNQGERLIHKGPLYQCLYPIYLDIKECHECRGCYLHNKPLVFWRGNPYAKIVHVGMNPGKQEHIQGIPWCGPAGQEQSRGYNYIGLDFEKDVFVTNVCKAHNPAPKGSGKENLRLQTEALTTCGKFVFKELDVLPSVKVILAAGIDAAVGLGVADRSEKMGKINGHIRMLKTPEGKEIPVVLSYHAAAILHASRRGEAVQNQLRWKLADSMERVKELIS